MRSTAEDTRPRPFYEDEWLTIFEGDCREVLAGLPSDSVDCVVTSPPYWGLRDYGTASWSGGDEACDHRPEVTGRAQRPSNGLTGGKSHVDAGTVRKGDCGKCGAIRQDSQLGLERTPEEYVANMVAVFREVRRVLKPSGTCWLNLGDSYVSSNSAQVPDTMRGASGKHGEHLTGTAVRPPMIQGLASKNLVGIPWRVAFALQADGWYLRSDIIWSKPNPMPESVTDRPTKSHEYLFLLTKSAKYFFDADAVREKSSWVAEDGTPLDSWGRPIVGKKYGRALPDDRDGERGVPTTLGANVMDGRRNIRSVWTIATRPYPGAHFAVFPPELPERCIKAGSSERGVCPECGAPWWRITERERIQDHTTTRSGKTMDGPYAHQVTTGDMDIRHGLSVAVTTLGWDRSCDCERDGGGWDPTPAVILDPFAGSGTVGLVANRLSRRAILIDLNPEYLKQQMKRNAQTPLGLSEGDAA